MLIGPEDVRLSGLDAGAVGLAIVLALTLAFFLLRQEESDETPDDSARRPSPGRGGDRDLGVR